MEILLLLGGIIGGIIITYLILQPKLKATKELDSWTQQQNDKIRIDNEELSERKKFLLNEQSSIITQNNQLELAKTQLEKENQNLENSKNLIIQSSNELKSTMEQSAQDYYNSQIQVMNERFEKNAEIVGKKHQEAEEHYWQEYSKLLQECAEDFESSIKEKKEHLRELTIKFDFLSKAVDNAVEASKRAEQIAKESEFYKLNLSDDDIKEIETLRGIIPQLRDPVPLNKVIWKCYYEKPYTSLVGRVVGPVVKTGIYKITCLESGKCYVGQAVDIASRWKQHIKRGVGAEAPTKNKLYPAMEKHGVENFTFEIIEECSPQELNAQEDYWQDYFHAKDYGYSIK